MDFLNEDLSAASFSFSAVVHSCALNKLKMNSKYVPVEVLTSLCFYSPFYLTAALLHKEIQCVQQNSGLQANFQHTILDLLH